MKNIKKPQKQLTIQIERIENPPKVNFGFQYLNKNSWSECNDVTFFKEFIERLSKFSSMTWQNLYQSPRHGFGTEKLPVKSVRCAAELPNGVDNLLVLRATGANNPFLGFRNGDTFEIVFIETRFGDIYNHYL